jgi:hypothetical protein
MDDHGKRIDLFVNLIMTSSDQVIQLLVIDQNAHLLSLELPTLVLSKLFDHPDAKRVLSQAAVCKLLAIHAKSPLFLSNPMAGTTAVHAAVECTDKDGNTPIHHAAMTGDDVCLELLSKQQHSMHCTNNHSDTPLMFAVNCNRVETTALILKRLTETDVNFQNKSFDTALLIAARSKETFPLVSLLLDHGAKVKIVGGTKRRMNAVEAAKKAVEDSKLETEEETKVIEQLEARLAEEEKENDEWLDHAALSEAASASAPVAGVTTKSKKKGKKANKGGAAAKESGGDGFDEREAERERVTSALRSLSSMGGLSKTLANGLVVSSHTPLSDRTAPADESTATTTTTVVAEAAAATMTAAEAVADKSVSDMFNDACCSALSSSDPDIINSLDLKVDHLLYNSHQLAMLSPEQLGVIMKILKTQSERVEEAARIQKRVLSMSP